MKLGLVRRGYSPSGGAERYLLRFADALLKAGHQAVLFASPAWPDGTWKQELVRIHGDNPRAFADALGKTSPRDRCDLLFSLERVWECDAYRAGDGVHRAWLDRRRAFEPPWKPWFRSLQPKHRDLLELEKSVFAAPDRLLIANSQMVAEEITRYFQVPSTQVRVIYNGLPTPPGDAQTSHRSHASHKSYKDPSTRQETRAHLALPDDTCAVLFAGSGWDRKGLRFAIEAINRTKNATLLVAGAGKRQNLPPSEKTRFLGEVTGLSALMEAADIFLLPTIYDPFSNASLEAMAAGLPVITTAANGFAEIMRPGLDGEILATAADIPGIAAAIEKWRTPEPPASLEARRNHARHYTIDENVRQTLEALTKI
jgi:UDP-glucose:(heptosyl)LPS alpha-1,3-glucosyltransferase